LLLPVNGETFCRFDDPVVQAYFRRRDVGTPMWAFHVKAGTSQPWFSPITLKVNWAADRSELRQFVDERGELRSRPQNVSFYFRPGFSWTCRAVRFYPYAIPSGCIPLVSRYMAYPRRGREYEALGVSAARVTSAFLRFYAEFWQRPNFLVEDVKMLPWPKLSDEAHAHFKSIVSEAVRQRREAYMNHEPFHEFVVPLKVYDFSRGADPLCFDKRSLIDQASEATVSEAFGFTPDQASIVGRDLLEAISFQDGGRQTESEGTEEDEAEEESAKLFLDISQRAQMVALVSYAVGCVFGRWAFVTQPGPTHLSRYRLVGLACSKMVRGFPRGLLRSLLTIRYKSAGQACWWTSVTF
jgi:hypothetical protein